MIFSCRNIEKSFGVNQVLKNVEFILEEGEKAAVIGANGAGKTTFFKILTGEISPDKGEITIKKGASIGYLSQMVLLDLNNTIEEELLTVFKHLIRLEETLRDLEHSMGRLAGGQLANAMDKYAKLSHEFEDKKGYEYRSRVRGVLKGLGFSDNEMGLKLQNLSGGQKTRVSLGKLLLTEPDLLLLDEPTNHLDIESVTWLEDNFLKNYPGSVLVISHDRYFLEKTVTKIMEIENGKSFVYNGSYSFYASQKEIIRDGEMKRYLDQQKIIKKQEESIKLLRSFNREKSIRRARSKEKALERMEKIEKPEDLPEKIRFSLAPRKQSGRDVLTAEDLSKDFEGEYLFQHISFEIKRGETVALVGPNGVGKTTLFKMILNHCQGIRLGANVETGYYDQEHAGLSSDGTIFSQVSDAYPHLKDLEVRNALAAFMFTGDDIKSIVNSLSGGEKARVAICKLMLGNANFLLLDEPTNHLDMQSREILEEALLLYEGTIFCISHDRYFINNTADRVLEMSSQGIVNYLGNYDYYVEKKAESRKLENGESRAVSPVKDEFIKRKEENSRERKKHALLKKLEKEIQETEEALKNAEYRLGLTEVNTNPDAAAAVYEEKMALEGLLLELYERLEDNAHGEGEV